MINFFKLIAGLAIVGLGILCFPLPATASAQTNLNIHNEEATYIAPYQTWLDKPYNKSVPFPEETVDLHLKRCPGFLAAGCAVPRGFWDKPNPTIWISDEYHTPEKLRDNKMIFYHELGHVFDYTHLDDTERREIIRMLGYPDDMTWYGDERGRPNELFANAAALCWFGPRAPWASYGYRFNYQETQPLCRAMTASFRDNQDWFG